MQPHLPRLDRLQLCLLLCQHAAPMLTLMRLLLHPQTNHLLMDANATCRILEQVLRIPWIFNAINQTVLASGLIPLILLKRGPAKPCTWILAIFHHRGCLIPLFFPWRRRQPMPHPAPNMKPAYQASVEHLQKSWRIALLDEERATGGKTQSTFSSGTSVMKAQRSKLAFRKRSLAMSIPLWCFAKCHPE